MPGRAHFLGQGIGLGLGVGANAYYRPWLRMIFPGCGGVGGGAVVGYYYDGVVVFVGYLMSGWGLEKFLVE